jgi:hypothetical protein
MAEEHFFHAFDRAFAEGAFVDMRFRLMWELLKIYPKIWAVPGEGDEEGFIGRAEPEELVEQVAAIVDETFKVARERDWIRPMTLTLSEQVEIQKAIEKLKASYLEKKEKDLAAGFMDAMVEKSKGERE